jgi:hypothetical protein
MNKIRVFAFAVLSMFLAASCGADSLRAHFDIDIPFTFIRESEGRSLRVSGGHLSSTYLAYGSATTTAEANAFYQVSDTISTSSPAVHDLTTMEDPDGAAFSFSVAKVVSIRNTSSSASVQIGSGTYAWPFGASGTVPVTTIPAGGSLCFFSPLSGFPVATGSANIVLSTTSATATYELLVIGLR